MTSCVVTCSTMLKRFNFQHSLSSVYTDFTNEFIHLRGQYSYILELNFANIKTKMNFCEVSIHFNCIKYKNSITDFVNE